MATTAQLRSWFPETIVSTSPLRCDYSTLVAVRFPAGGDVAQTLGRPYIDLKVHPKTKTMWQAIAAVMLHHGYTFDEWAGGTAVCRLITSGSGTSIHAHACAGDFNPSRNSYRTTAGGGLIQWGRHTDMSKAMIADLEGIRTGNGRQAVQWGGRWWSIKDPMHFEPDTHPNNLATGIRLSTVPGWDRYVRWLQGDTMEGHLPIKLEDGFDNGPRPWKRSDVAALQAKLNRAFGAGLKTDGFYGDATAAAIADHLPDDGNPTGSAFYGNRADDLDWALALKAARSITTGGGAGVSLTQVRAEIDTHAKAEASPTVHPHRHPEGTTGQPRS